MSKFILRYAFISISLLSLIACGGGGDGGSSDTDDLPVSTFEVDTSVQPSQTELPGFDELTSRPLVAMQDEDGVVTDFVANELWVTTEDSVALDALVARWDGEILMRVDEASTKITGFPTQALIRVDVSSADATTLADDAKALVPDRRGDLKLSSEAAMQLLAVSAQESRNGMMTGINFVGEGSVFDVASRVSDEAPVVENGYTSNAFTWDFMDANSEQNIGVTEAWRALDAAGKLTEGSVELAILDMGFAPDEDFPNGFTAVSNQFLVPATGTPNLIGCGTGNPCPWHGTNVLGAAMGVPGNNHGAAGPAGPVADPIMIFTVYGYFDTIAAISLARAQGARIVNMSYGGSVPSFLSWTYVPYDAAMLAYHELGNTLLFASAGNGGDDGIGDDVDAESCFLGLCWESRQYAPCESPGVICVGGLATNSKERHSSSNYGDEQVDIFAPFTVLVGPDPANPDNVARSVGGTSIASPYVAGVAALIKAADPSLSANEIEQILLDTAHTSPEDDDVTRYVNAGAAIRTVLGDVPPSINVISPDNGSTRQLNQAVNFVASAFDPEDETQCCILTWESDVDGFLSNADSFLHTFTSVGPRVITVRTTDIAGSTTTRTINLNIVNSAPTVSITRPEEGEEILLGVPFNLRGSSFDVNEVNTSLPCGSMIWTSTAVTDLIGPGCERIFTFVTTGTRTLTLTGTDSEGSSASDSRTVTVVLPPSNLPPQVLVTSPLNGSEIPDINSPLLLTAAVSDDTTATEDLIYVWTVTLFGDTTQIGTEKDINWIPSSTIDFSGGGGYTLQLRLSVTDTSGNTNSDFVEISSFIIN